MSRALERLAEAHGIETVYRGIDGLLHAVPDATLEALVEALGGSSPEASAGSPAPVAGIAEARAERDPLACHVPVWLAHGRAWGLTCQVTTLRSGRNLGIGDFADLAELCGIAGRAGADFVGVNPLHAQFWSDPARFSPFFPSNRRFVSPMYLAAEWIEGFDGLTAEERADAEAARAGDLVEPVAVHRLKDRVLRRLHAGYPWTAALRRDYQACLEAGGEALRHHATFEALARASVTGGGPASCTFWPDRLRRSGPDADAAADRDEVAFHLWLQWQAQRQLERVRAAGAAAGLRIGLYVDCAVGAAPDGSAAWSDPDLTVPGLSIGAPPDAFTLDGQDWGLAPLSPTRLSRLDGAPLAEIMAAAMRGAGAMRIDHAMNLARLWLIPRGRRSLEGAYVRYPLATLLRRLAEVSRERRTMVIGEDLGVVPEGFRELMSERALHGYRVFFFEREEDGFADPGLWPVDALACAGTHDTHTVTGWWRGYDLHSRRSLGQLSLEQFGLAEDERRRDRDAVLLRTGLPAVGAGDRSLAVSVALHAAIAASPCRLAALQVEDALGMLDQVNMPGTVDEHANWRRRLPVDVAGIPAHPGFGAHVEAMARARPR